MIPLYPNFFETNFQRIGNSSIHSHMFHSHIHFISVTCFGSLFQHQPYWKQRSNTHPVLETYNPFKGLSTHPLVSALHVVLFLSFLKKNLSMASGSSCSVVQSVDSKRHSGNHSVTKSDSPRETATPSFAAGWEKGCCVVNVFPAGWGVHANPAAVVTVTGLSKIIEAGSNTLEQLDGEVRCDCWKDVRRRVQRLGCAVGLRAGEVSLGRVCGTFRVSIAVLLHHGLILLEAVM